jgi:hypothetical protein
LRPIHSAASDASLVRRMVYRVSRVAASPAPSISC